MTFPCSAVCFHGEFCDVITRTCFPCYEVCDPRRNTANECNHNCPGYVLPTTPRPLTSITPAALPPDNTSDVRTVLVSVVTVICLFGVAALVAVFVYWFAWKRPRRFRSRHDSHTAEVGSRASPCYEYIGNTDATRTPSCQGDGFNNGTSHETDSTKLLSGRLESDKHLSSATGTQKLPGTASMVTAGVPRTCEGIETPGRAEEERDGSLRMDTMYTPVLLTPASQPQHSAAYAFQSDAPVGHLLGSTLASPHATPPESHHGNHWDSVMRVYDIVDQRLHELSWIAGCMISDTALRITAKSSESEDRRRAFTHQLRNVIPGDVSSDRYLLTFQGPALQATAGTRGSGSLVHVGHGAGRSTVTVMGRCGKGNGRVYRPASYALTAGHVAHRGDECQVFNRAGIVQYQEQPASGRCVGHIDTVQQSYVKDIKHKIYDLALIEMGQNCAITNSREFDLDGKKVTLKVDLNKRDITPKDLKPASKVLIFGGPKLRVIEASVDARAPCYTCRLDTATGVARQTVNLIQLDTTATGGCQLLPGHSGSLVAWRPLPGTQPQCADGSLVVMAFAMVVGVNAECPEKGFAVPLWEQMHKLFRTDASFTDLEKHLVFDDYLDESGYFTSM